MFIGVRDWGTGLMVVDTATGTYRMLLRGIDVRVPDWFAGFGTGRALELPALAVLESASGKSGEACGQSTGGHLSTAQQF